MLVTLPSVGITLFLHPAIKVLLFVSIKQLPALWYTLLFLSTVMLSRLEQPENAEEPMLVTLFGIVMLVRLEQYLNAQSPMLVTLFGIVMLVIFEQLSNAPYKMLPPVIVTEVSDVGI